MAIVADYVVIETATWCLQVGGTFPNFPEKTFVFDVPDAILLTPKPSFPLLHFRMGAISPSTSGDSMYLDVEINGAPVFSPLFLATQRDVLLEQPLFPGPNDTPVIKPGPNKIRFLPRPITDPQARIFISNVILWFQRKSTAPE